jgi:hypothetical protein
MPRTTPTFIASTTNQPTNSETAFERRSHASSIFRWQFGQRHTRDFVVLALMLPLMLTDDRVLVTAKVWVITFLGQISWHSKHSAFATFL